MNHFIKLKHFSLLGLCSSMTALAAPAINGIFNVGINIDGRQEVFYRGGDGTLYHRWQNTPSGAWSGEQRLGGTTLTSVPIVGKNANGTLEVFYRGGDGALYHRWQNSSGWSGEDRLGDAMVGQPAVGINADGRLELFYRGTDNSLWHRWQNVPSGGWSSAQSLGGVLTAAPVAARNADGRQQVFVIGTDGGLWTISQLVPNGGWSSFQSLGGSWVNPPAIARNQDGRLQLFLAGTDNAMWSYTQNAPSAVNFSLSKMGGYLTSAPAAGTNKDGRLEVYYRGSDNAMYHRYQLAANGGWSGDDRMGGILTSTPVTGVNADGRQEVYYRGTDNAMYHRYQLAPNGGWSGDDRMGNIMTDPNASPNTFFVFSQYKEVTTGGVSGNVMQTRVNGSSQSQTSAMPARNTTLTWAFAAGACGYETWDGISGSSFAAANVPAFVNAGKKYIVSTGGAGQKFTCSSDADFATFIRRYYSANLVGIDFDIEYTQTASEISSLVQRAVNAQSSYPGLRFSFTIATLGGNRANSLNSQGAAVVQAVKASGLRNYTINLMAMDYGSNSAGNCTLKSNGLCDMGISANQAAINLHNYYGIPYANIELTPLIGENDIIDEIFTIADANTMANFVKQNGLAGVHFWAFDRDVDCPFNPAGSPATCNGVGNAGRLGYTNTFLNALGL